jgi:hydroxymethylpyrimidine pyrophosphatase-like HAD family hydrolase
MNIEPYLPDKEKPPAIIVDIDGTLAHHDRHHHDYDNVADDTVDSIIRDLIDREWGNGYDILIVTGRPSTCYGQTYKWLLDNHIPVDGLWMRNPKAVDEKGQKLEDWVVKLYLFNQYIRADYNVAYVLEDRNQCVEMWRKLGLKTLQVQEGDF